MQIEFFLSAILVLSGVTGVFAAGTVFTPLASPHADYNFNPGWMFIREDVAGAEQIAFDDSKWSDVSAPHTYNDVDSYT